VAHPGTQIPQAVWSTADGRELARAAIDGSDKVVLAPAFDAFASGLAKAARAEAHANAQLPAEASVCSARKCIDVAAFRRCMISCLGYNISADCAYNCALCVLSHYLSCIQCGLCAGPRYRECSRICGG
jgi:hypothetical protein